MSKKVNATAATTATAPISEFFEKYPNVSIRRLALATNINYMILLKKSKAPIPGEAYDPEAINWAAVEEKLTSKGVDWNTLDWEAMNAASTRRSATLQKSIDAFSVGDKVYLRRDNTTPYEILYKTETHIVIMKVGTSEPQAWANNTFLMNGPVFEPRATTKKVAQEPEQVDGEYVVNEESL